MHTFFSGKEGSTPKRYDALTRAKAVRLVREHPGDYPTEYAAISAVAGRLGLTPETLHHWIRQAEVDEGTVPGSTAESVQIRACGRVAWAFGVSGRVRLGVGDCGVAG